MSSDFGITNYRLQCDVQYTHPAKQITITSNKTDIKIASTETNTFFYTAIGTTPNPNLIVSLNSPSEHT